MLEWLGDPRTTQALCTGLVLWYIKYGFNGIGKKIKELESQQSLMRENLPVEYASKKETRAELDKLWSKADRNGENISRIEGKIEGKSK